MVVLIGENNSGKTNVMEALHWTLNPERSLQSLEVTDQDFYAPGEPLVIEVEFSDPDMADHALFADYFDLDPYEEQKEKLNLRFQCIYNPDTEEFEKTLSINKRQPRTMTARERRAIPFYFLKANRDASDTRVNPYTLFGRLISSIHIDRQTPSMTAALEEANRALMGNREVVTIADELARIARRTIPIAARDSVLTMGISSSEPNELKRSIRLYLRETDGSRPLPLDRFGLGTQSTVVIATFIAFARRGELKNATLGIDEPESHLHPQAQRHMLSDLQTLSQTNQVWIATHSTQFLACTDPRQLVLLRKREGATMACQLPGDFPSEVLSRIPPAMDPGVSEVFFARGVALAASEMEAAALPLLARALDDPSLDFDRLGLSIVAAGDPEQSKALRTLLSAFEIPSLFTTSLWKDRDFEEIVSAESDPAVRARLCEVLSLSATTSAGNIASALKARNSRVMGQRLAEILCIGIPETIQEAIREMANLGR